ncbi:MAG: 23S rRNA (guanosine(2251)-2'-O)-methyltransferase RlmB [Nitrospirae bacterium]|nr:MAG: 23S rRNA (guanosine(2251)-2'-O)-methyltransferase RlmB [Nitrospirota bacterium]
MVRPAGNVDQTEYLYGLHAVGEALRQRPRSILRILVSRHDRPILELKRLAQSQHIPVYGEPRERLDRLVPHGRHQGVIGVITVKPYDTEEETLAYAFQQRDPPLFVVLDGIEDPQNLGAILRSAAAAGVHGVFIPDRRAVGLTAGVARASAGALEYIRVVRVPNIGKLLTRLRACSIPAHALTPYARQVYTEWDLRGPLAFVFGAEGKGIRPGVLRVCEAVGRIPLRSPIDSLNVSASVAVVLFEAVRQRSQPHVEG